MGILSGILNENEDEGQVSGFIKDKLALALSKLADHLRRAASKIDPAGDPKVFTIRTDSGIRILPTEGVDVIVLESSGSETH